MNRLAIRTATVMYQGAEGLVTTLVHKGRTFNHSLMVTIAAFVNGGRFSVEIDRDALAEIGVNVLAAYSHTKTESFASNTLYLSTIPPGENFFRAMLVHEAVHMEADLAGKKFFLLDNEEMAYFVEGFVFAQLDKLNGESSVKKDVREDSPLLIGCLASDFHNDHPNLGAISSEQFNKPISFDYTKEGGVKGKVNPFNVLVNWVQDHYPHGKINGKKVLADFDGL